MTVGTYHPHNAMGFLYDCILSNIDHCCSNVDTVQWPTGHISRRHQHVSRQRYRCVALSSLPVGGIAVDDITCPGNGNGVQHSPLCRLVVLL